MAPDAVMAQAASLLGARLTPAGEAPRRRAFAGSLGSVTVTAVPEGGHYTLVTVQTDQPGESELDAAGEAFPRDGARAGRTRPRPPRRDY